MAIRRDFLRNSHGFAQVVANSLRVCISAAMSFLKRQTVEVRHSVFHYSKAIGLDQFIVGHGQIELGSRCRPSNIGFAQERAFVFCTKRTTHGSINTRKLRLFKRPDGIYGTRLSDWLTATNGMPLPLTTARPRQNERSTMSKPVLRMRNSNWYRSSSDLSLPTKWLSSFETYRCKSTILRFRSRFVCTVPPQRRPARFSLMPLCKSFPRQHWPPVRPPRDAQPWALATFCCLSLFDAASRRRGPSMRRTMPASSSRITTARRSRTSTSSLGQGVGPRQPADQRSRPGGSPPTLPSYPSCCGMTEQ